MQWRHHARFMLQMPGMSNHLLKPIILDQRFVLDHVTPANAFRLCALANKTVATLEEAVTITHCLSYLHDAPVLLEPAGDRSRRALVQPAMGKLSGHRYYETLEQIYQTAHELRLGSGVVFECVIQEAASDTINLDLVTALSPRLKEIAIYSTALRQTDPLSEFLHYYRIIESVEARPTNAHNNGKKTILRLPLCQRELSPRLGAVCGARPR
jgi:hypothetical protein